MLRDKLTSEYAVTLEVASDTQIYRALAMITREIMSDRQKKFRPKRWAPATSRSTTCAWSF